MKKMLLLVLGLILMSFAVSAVTYSQVGDVGVFKLDQIFPRVGSTLVEDSSKNVHILWEDLTDIRYEKVNATGSLLVNVTSVVTATTYALEPVAGIDSNDNIHLIYTTNNSGHFEVYYKKLNSTGGTLIPGTRLTTTSSDNNNAYLDLKVDNANNVHITWSSRNSTTVFGAVHYMKLDGSNGNVLVDKAITSDNSGFSRLDVDSSGNVHLAYINLIGIYTLGNLTDFQSEVAYVKLNGANGNILVGPKLETSGAVIFLDQEVDIGVDSAGNAHLVWADNRSGTGYELYYTKVNGTNGNLIVSNTKITTSPSGNNSINPRLGVESDGNLRVIYKLRSATDFTTQLLKLSNTGSILSGPTSLGSDLANPIIITGSAIVCGGSQDACYIGLGGTGGQEEPLVPEFSKFGYILVIGIIVVVGVFVMTRKNKSGKTGLSGILILSLLALGILGLALSFYGCTQPDPQHCFPIDPADPQCPVCHRCDAGDCQFSDAVLQGRTRQIYCEREQAAYCESTKDTNGRPGCGCKWV